MDYQSYPVWVEKVGIQSGRDHLGLESVGESMLEDLLSGISNITQRIRYCSFFSWVLKKFFESSSPKDNKNYRLFLDRASFLYAFSTSSSHLDSSRSGIDGIDYIRRNIEAFLNGQKTADDLFFKNKEYRNNNWIYKAKLDDLRLTLDDQKTGVPWLLKPYGENLALAFDAIAKNFDINSTNTDNLKKLSSTEEKPWCFHFLKNNDSERNILENLLFSKDITLDNQDKFDKKYVTRRYSLILFLQYIQKEGKKGRQYFERWINKNDTVHPINLNKTKLYWQLLFARNYLVYSLESLFMFFLHSISKEPLSLNEFMERLSKLSLSYNNVPISLDSSWLDLLKTTSNGEAESSLCIELESIGEKNSDNNINKFIIYPLIILIKLYDRWSKVDFKDSDLLYFQRGGFARFSLNHFITHFKNQIENNKKISETIFNLYQDYLLPRHTLISSQKMIYRNLDTFHFLFDEGRFKEIKRDRVFQPKYNFMKIDQVFNFLEDLDLIQNPEQNTYLVTNKGDELLKRYYE